MGNIVCFDRHLPGKDRCSSGLRLVKLPLRILSRELKPALGAEHHRQADKVLTLRTRLRQGTAPFPIPRSRFPAFPDKVNWPEPLDVTPVIKDKALLLPCFGRKAKASAYHLHEKPCTVRRP